MPSFSVGGRIGHDAFLLTVSMVMIRVSPFP